MIIKDTEEISGPIKALAVIMKVTKPATIGS